MRCGIDRDADELLDRKVFDLLKVIRIALLKDRNESAGTGCVNTTVAGVKLDYVGSSRQRISAIALCVSRARTVKVHCRRRAGTPEILCSRCVYQQ